MLSNMLRVALRGGIVTATISAVAYYFWWHFGGDSFTPSEVPWSGGVRISRWWDIVSFGITGAAVFSTTSLLDKPKNASEETTAGLLFMFISALSMTAWLGLSCGASSLLKHGDVVLMPMLLLPSIILPLAGLGVLFFVLHVCLRCGQWIFTGSCVDKAK